MKKIVTTIPYMLIWLRLTAGIVIITSSLHFFNNVFILILFLIGFISDIADGIIARRLGVSSSRLRRMDSNIDTIFYLCAFSAVVVHNAALLYPILIWVFTIVGLKIVRYIFDIMKFGKETSYHMYSAKLWGIFLMLFYCDLLLNNRIGPIAAATVIVGIVTNIESFFASVVLRNWEQDVPSIITVINRASKKRG